MELLQESGISTRPGTHAVHMLGFYADHYGIKPEDFPGAQIANDKSISIPLHNQMTSESPEAINYLNKKYNPSILIINSKLYNQEEKEYVIKNWTLEKIAEFENYNMYRVV